MGFFKIFEGSGSDSSYKGRVRDDLSTRRTVDKFEHHDEGKHSHHSYNQNIIGGKSAYYKEYHGGENSDDRSYNK